MARNEIFIEVPPREVFAVLEDPRSYGIWVLGSRRIRAADPDWPEPGTAFDHSVGTRFGEIRDDTSVIASRPPVMLSLCAKARPLPKAVVTLHLQPEGEGTRVTMIERPANRLLSILSTPVGHGLIRARNARALERLKELAEGTRPMPTGELPPRGGEGGGGDET